MLLHETIQLMFLFILCMIDKPLWGLLAASGATHWWCMPNNDDDDDNWV